MADMLGGGATGVAIDLLLKAILDVTIKVKTFNSELNHLESTLISIKPVVEDIEKLNRVLNSRQEGAGELANRFREGENLVRKCMEVGWWNAIKKYRYAKKLKKFEASLLWFFQINVQAELTRDGKNVAVGIKVLEEKMNEIISIKDNGRSVNSNGFPGWCGVLGFPDIVVGLDARLQELKEMLQKDGVPVRGEFTVGIGSTAPTT